MRILPMLLLIFSSIKSFGTAQMPDYLIYKEDTVAIYANPLEAYFDGIGIRPVPEENLPTDCWRGYVALWELRNDSIFLKGISYYCEYSFNSAANLNLAKLFGLKYKNKEVFADWVDFEIIQPFGKLVKYIHQGYNSIYEFERGFEFNKGILTKMTVYDNSKSKQSIYAQNTDTLMQFLYKTIHWNALEPLCKEDRITVVVQFIVNESGKIEKIKMVKGINETYNKEAIRVVKLIPLWEVHYKKGKFTPSNWTLPIRFDKAFYEKRINK